MYFPTPNQRERLKRLVKLYRDGDNWPLGGVNLHGDVGSELKRVAGFTQEAIRLLGLDVELHVGEGVPDHFRYVRDGPNVIWLGRAEIEIGLHEIGHACFGKSERHAVTFSVTLLI